MNADVGAAADSGLVRTVVATSAHVDDGTQAHMLLHGKKSVTVGDAGCRGLQKREGNRDRTMTWHMTIKQRKCKSLPTDAPGALREGLKQANASVRGNVEYPFHVVKNLFKDRKTRYRSLARNEAQLFALFGLANLMLARRRLFALHTRGTS